MGIATLEKLEEIDDQIKSSVEEAVKYAQQSPFPEPTEVTTDLSA
jgi:pyruvate dehydrogenase E1 component alpha subunit